MKPTFALDLTRDVVGLLHRSPKGWLPLGEAAFDAPDLDEALAYLRKTALGLSPMGMATKIVLPNSQILYTEVNAPGPSRDEKRRQIAAALEGQTPYAVDDLVFDWSGKGATVKVAVVARETLAEAEGFASQHRLNPVGFVAIPEDGTFVGEPFFGQTAAAADSHPARMASGAERSHRSWLVSARRKAVASASVTPRRRSRLSALSLARVRSLRHRSRSWSASASSWSRMPGVAMVSMTRRCGWSAGSGSSGATLKAAAVKPPSITTKATLRRREFRDSHARVRCRCGFKLSNDIGGLSFGGTGALTP